MNFGKRPIVGKKKKLCRDVVIELNRRHYDGGVAAYKLKAEMKMGLTVIESHLFPTRNEWEQFKTKENL